MKDSNQPSALTVLVLAGGVLDRRKFVRAVHRESHHIRAEGERVEHEHLHLNETKAQADTRNEQAMKSVNLRAGTPELSVKRNTFIPSISAGLPLSSTVGIFLSARWNLQSK